MVLVLKVRVEGFGDVVHAIETLMEWATRVSLNGDAKRRSERWSEAPQAFVTGWSAALAACCATGRCRRKRDEK